MQTIEPAVFDNYRMLITLFQDCHLETTLLRSVKIKWHVGCMVLFVLFRIILDNHISVVCIWCVDKIFLDNAYGTWKQCDVCTTRHICVCDDEQTNTQFISCKHNDNIL